MSSNFARYGQQKKRQAIRQIQQRSKRLANSQRNPFIWTRDGEAEDSSNDKASPEDSSKPLPLQASLTQASNNPFITELKTSTEKPTNIFAESNVAGPSNQMFAANIFAGNTVTEPRNQPFATSSQPLFVGKTDTEKQTNIFAESNAIEPPNQPFTVPSDPIFSVETVISRKPHVPTLRGKRNPATKAQNRQQLLHDFTNFKLTETIKPGQFQRKRGTCMHMCSVREYNKRFEQDIYSTVEMKDCRFVHHLAVKEYQRASADQEESQPEDLRPSVILLKTVQYLYIDLLQNHKESFEEIYDFIWNRTRAIRKDITQQRLCDVNTVFVLETIARFHIFSAYYMSGSTSGNFEHKYNNENLEKTLTSLRHIYDDLSISNDVCKNEAEFRMYYILLNMNSGLVMRDVASLPPSILNSQYVRYALHCYNAYNSKNFLRFFKLFRAGPLLACCILYRYINNIRQKALAAIINSNTTPSKNPSGGTSVDYPISKLMSMLGCESPDETVDFVQSMGVEVSSNMEHALLRNRHYEVNDNIVTHRLSSIDSKIELPIGRIIFTEQLISDEILGGPIPQSPTLPPASVARNIVPQAVLDSVVDQYLAQTAISEVQNMISECFRELQYLEQSKIHIIKELLDEACHSALKEEFTNIKNDVKKQGMMHTKEMYKDWYPSPLLDHVLRDVVMETLVDEAGLLFVQENQYNLLTTTVKGELRSILNTDSAYLSQFENKMDNVCETTYNGDLLDTVMKKELQSMILETQGELLAEKKCDLKHRLESSLVQKRYYFKVWKKRYSKIYAKRHTLDDIPPRIVPSSSSEVLQSLLGANKSLTQDKSHLRLSDIAHIDLTSPTKSYQKKIDVKKKLQLRMDLLEEAMSLRGIPLKCLYTASKPVYVTLAVENSSSSLSKFVMDSFGLSGLDNAIDKDSKAVHVGGSTLKVQLINLSQASNKTLRDACKSCHVIVLQSNNNRHASLVSELSTVSSTILISEQKPNFWNNFHVQEPVSLTNIRCCNLYKALNSTVKEALKRERQFPPFKIVEIRDFTQSLLCVKLTDILLAKQVVLKDCKLYSVDPNIIISFYNSIIRHLSKAVINDDLKSIDWPSGFDQRKDINLNWNDDEKMSNLSSELQSLRLPNFNGEPDSSNDCIKYCSTIKTFSPQFLLSTVSSILENSGVQWCLILNQIIHHLIENALFLDSYTILLDSQISEIYAINGEKIVESALIFNELEDELAEYQSEPFTFNESDIAEIWQSLSYYESKISGESIAETKTLPADYLTTESEQLESITEDLEKLTSSISETELRLQSIVNDGALPSYLVKSLLGNQY